MLIIVFAVTARGESSSSLLMDECVVNKSGYGLSAKDCVDIPKWRDILTIRFQTGTRSELC